MLGFHMVEAGLLGVLEQGLSSRALATNHLREQKFEIHASLCFLCESSRSAKDLEGGLRS